MIKFKNYLRENSFYTTQSEKDIFMNDDKAIINAFIFSFIGTISILNIVKDASIPQVKTYFKQDQKVRVDTITDDNHDVSLIVKIMSEKGFFKKPTTANQITRLLAKMKTGAVDNIDEAVVRDWLDQIKVDKIMLLSTPVKKRVKTFIDGGTLNMLALELKDFAVYRSSGKMKDTEYFKLAKLLKFDGKKINAVSTSVDSVDASSSTNTNSVKSTASASQIVKSVEPTAKPAKPVKVLIKSFDTDGVIADFKKASSAEEAAAGWKINNGNRSELLTVLVNQYVAGAWNGYAKEWKSVLEYLNKNGVNEGVLQKAMFGDVTVSGYNYSSSPITKSVLRIETLLDSGLFDLYKNGKANKRLTDIIARVRKNILDKTLQATTLSALESYKNSVSSFFNSPIAVNSLSAMGGSLAYRAADHFLMSKPVDDFFIAYQVKNELTKNIDGTYSFDFDQYNPPALSVILKSFGVTKINPAAANIKKIENNYTFRWSDFSIDDLKNMQEALKALKDADVTRYNSIAVKILQNYKTTPSSTSGWDDITKMVAESVNIQNIIDKVNDSYAAISIETLPVSLKIIILKRIGDLLKKTPLSKNVDTQSNYSDNSPNNILQRLDKLLTLFESSNMIDSYKKVFSDEYVKLVRLIVAARHPYFSGSFSLAVPNNSNKFSKLITKDQQDDLDSYILEMSTKNDAIISGPISFYASMSSENKKKVIDLINGSSFFENLKLITDNALLNDLDPKDFVKNVGTVDKLIALNFDTTEYMDKVLALPESKERINHMFNSLTSRSDMHNIRKTLSILTKSKEVSQTAISYYANNFFANLRSDHTYHVTAIVGGLQGDNFNSKDAVLLEKSLAHIDKTVNKLKNEYKEFMTSAQPAFIDYVNSDRAAAEKMYWSMSGNMKKRMASAYMSNKEFAGLSAINSIQNGAIAPFEKLTDARIKQILKYNNVVSEETRIPDKHIRDFTTMDAYVKANKDVKPIADLSIEEVQTTPKEMAQFTADIHRIKRSNKHGRQSLVFKKSFKVAIPMQAALHKAWIEKYPKQEIINPMYHGTGSIAASMILRYGFAVIKSGDSSVVGRMLGDGIYGATNIDKSQQYVGDAGFGRNVGTKGYIFEMDAALGEKNKDYKAMGLGGSDGIRSPEWCVFTPNSQFLIFKAHEVEIVSESTIEKVLRENPPSARLKENKGMMRFKQYLKEYVVDTSDYENYTTFTFVNGLIPMSSKGGDIVDFEEFKSPNPDTITLEPSAYGPSIVVRGTEEQNDYLFTSPTDLIENHPEVFQEYLRYFTKK